VLLLGRHMRREHVVAGLAAALRGALTSDAVALEARKAAESDPGPAVTELALPQPQQETNVVYLAARLPADTRPLPSVAVYDQLLRRSGPAPPSSQGG
jgi:hypothetical protein